ncbi:preprotein translocase subunit SecG [Blattabacterium cuenoti]|uniref:preprotein translocase subunit SecG n=1 Tax=Blattabacterium cuenoti TaxID=1653831 RepID=UPI00293BFEDC|nr:preprotein translocase subunit SecG [Blattabacterium cuenoti]
MILLSIFIIFICCLLIIIILIQNPKKGMFYQPFIENKIKFFGIKQTNLFLINITWILAIIILVSICLFNILLKIMS